MLTILGAFCLICFALTFPETCRNVVGDGAGKPQSWNRPVVPFNMAYSSSSSQNANEDQVEQQTQQRTPKRTANPFKCLKILWNVENALILASNALFYMNYSCIQAALAPLVMDYYRLNSLDAGLCYLAYGIATVLSSYAVGKLMDRDYKITARQAGITINKVAGDNVRTFPIEKARLRSIWYFILLASAATIGFGWAVERRVHLSVPLILQFICGVSYTGVFNVCTLLLLLLLFSNII